MNKGFTQRELFSMGILTGKTFMGREELLKKKKLVEWLEKRYVNCKHSKYYSNETTIIKGCPKHAIIHIDRMGLPHHKCPVECQDYK